MDVLITLLFLFLFAFFCIFMGINLIKNNKKKFEKFITENEVTVTKKSNQFQDTKHIIFDEKKRLLWIYQPSAKTQISFPIHLITGCEFKIDDETNFKTSVSSAAGRAIVGGVLAGGVGAIIGGVTANKKGTSMVKSMELDISTSDLNCPYVRIIVYKNNTGLKKDSIIFNQKYNDAMYWCKFIEALTTFQKTEPVQ